VGPNGKARLILGSQNQNAESFCMATPKPFRQLRHTMLSFLEYLWRISSVTVFGPMLMDRDCITEVVMDGTA